MFGFTIASRLVHGKWPERWKYFRNMSGGVTATHKPDPVLRKAELDFIRTLEKQNQERVEKLLRIRRNNIITGSLLAAGVLSIYLYTMYAVKQETFLDDLEEPEKITKD